MKRLLDIYRFERKAGNQIFEKLMYGLSLVLFITQIILLNMNVEAVHAVFILGLLFTFFTWSLWVSQTNTSFYMTQFLSVKPKEIIIVRYLVVLELSSCLIFGALPYLVNEVTSISELLNNVMTSGIILVYILIAYPVTSTIAQIVDLMKVRTLNVDEDSSTVVVLNKLRKRQRFYTPAIFVVFMITILGEYIVSSLRLSLDVNQLWVFSLPVMFLLVYYDISFLNKEYLSLDQLYKE